MPAGAIPGALEGAGTGSAAFGWRAGAALAGAAGVGSGVASAMTFFNWRAWGEAG